MGGKSKLPKPTAVRLPVSDNSPVRSFAQKTLPQFAQRQGQSSNILTDMLKSITGSIGLLGR